MLTPDPVTPEPARWLRPPIHETPARHDLRRAQLFDAWRRVLV